MKTGTKSTALAFMVVGVLVLAFGCYIAFFETKGYVATTAVIERIEEYESGIDADGFTEYSHDVYVSYSVNGRLYEAKSDYYSARYREGQEIKIFYNPDNPEQIHGDSKNFGIYMMVLGPVLTLIGAVVLFRRVA